MFSSVDYTNKINFKRWTVYYSDSEFYIWLTATLLIKVRFKDKIMLLCRTNGLPTNKLLAILIFWRRVLSLHRERITMLPGTVRLTQDNSRQRCKTGVNKTKVTRNQVNKKRRLIRSAILNALVPWYLQQQITLSIFFLTGSAITIKKRRTICPPKKCSK